MILSIGDLVGMLMVSLTAMGLALAVGFGLHFVELGFHDSVFMHGVGSIKRFHRTASPQFLYESILFMKMSADTDGGIGDKSRDKTAYEQRCENRNGEDNHFMPQFSIILNMTSVRRLAILPSSVLGSPIILVLPLPMTTMRLPSMPWLVR